MTRQLKENITIPLKTLSPEIIITGGWDRVEIETPDTVEIFQNMERILARTPGIAFTLAGKRIANSTEIPKNPSFTFPDGESKGTAEMEHIASVITESYQAHLQNMSFVVRIKRSGVHSFTSPEIERFVGGVILQNIPSARVDLHTPQIMVTAEIKEKTLFIPHKKIMGMGGFPIQKLNRVLMLISGGYDSGVAAYLMMKRGCAVDFCFFNLGGQAHEVGVKQVSYYLSKEFSHGYVGNIFTVPFEGVVKDLLENTPARYRGVLLKRMMLRSAEQIAKEGKHIALVTGESLAQVSSQTLKNLTVIEDAVQIPVFRPLLTMEKQEIITLAEKIGTEVFARSMPEYCGVISQKPSTGSDKKDILEAESHFHFPVLEDAIVRKKREGVQQVEMNVADIGNVERTSEVEENSILVDIRAPGEQQRSPLKEVHICIPFYDLKEKILTLDASKTYLLFCQKGVLSRLHALYLQDKGLKIKIYRPE